MVEGAGGSIDIGGSEDYLTQAVTKLNDLHGDIRLTEGDNITLEVIGNEVVISANRGQDGGITDIPQATDTKLGGVRASKRTDNEVSEVKIDANTGKLYTTAPNSAINGIPTGGKSGQVLTKVDDTNYNVEWTNVSRGVETTVLLNGANTISGRTSRGFGNKLRALTAFSVKGIMVYTDWDRGVEFTGRLLSGGNVVATSSIIGDGGTEWKEIVFDKPFSVDFMEVFDITIEKPSGNLSKYYSPAYTYPFLVSEQAYSGLPDDDYSTAGSPYAIGVIIELN